LDTANISVTYKHTTATVWNCGYV